MTDPTKNYVHSEGRSPTSLQKITAEEINVAFRQWGIIGKRRIPSLFVKTPAHFERSTSSAGKA